MEPVIAAAWREVAPRAYKRDVLVALAICGPTTGTDLHQRIRGPGEASAVPHTHQTLRELDDRGLVERTEGEDGRERLNALSAEGWALVREGVIKPAARIEAGERSGSKG